MEFPPILPTTEVSPIPRQHIQQKKSPKRTIVVIVVVLVIVATLFLGAWLGRLIFASSETQDQLKHIEVQTHDGKRGYMNAREKIFPANLDNQSVMVHVSPNPETRWRLENHNGTFVLQTDINLSLIHI